MDVAILQMSSLPDGPDANLEKAVHMVRKSAGADLVVLPELWPIGYFNFEWYLSNAESVSGGPILKSLREVAKEVRAHIHSGSFVEEDGGRFFNSSYLLSPQGEIVANYRKLHLFGHESREACLLEPGKLPVVAETSLGKVGMATCYDLRFPEQFRQMVGQGCEVFLVCAAWPYQRLEDWVLLNRVRALENQSYIVSANAVGVSGKNRLGGHSLVAGPDGSLVSVAGDDETILEVSVDIKAVVEARASFPAVADFLMYSRNAGT